MDNNQSESGPRELIHEFYKLQEERVKAHNALEIAHKQYLNSAPNYDFPSYRQRVHDVTEDFNRISQRIIAIEQILRTEHRKMSIAECLSEIQKLEKERLELTAELQLVKQNVQDLPGDDEVKELMKLIKQRLAKHLQELADQLENLKYETENL